MKHRLLLKLCAAVTLMAGIPLAAMAQEQTFTASYRSASVSQVVRDIESQTGLSVLLETEAGKTDGTVTGDFDKAPVMTVLKRIFGDDCKIVFKEKVVIISVPSRETVTPAERPEPAAAGDAVRQFTGRVVDESGEPVIAAGVMIDGTAIGVITDVDGRFTIGGVDDASIVTVSALGYQKRTVSVGGRDNVVIELLSDNMMLDEIVVVGFGTAKKVNLTGSVATVQAKELEKRPVASATQALQGLDPSLNITFNSGNPDSSQKLTIRGAVSVNAGSPLVLVDGMELDLRFVNPNDIESISILKDASASAIYGTKASAGVVLVTTKTGSKSTDKANITFSSGVSLVKSTTSTDFITVGYDHARLTQEFYNRTGDGNCIKMSDAEMQLLYDRRNDVTENPERPWVITGTDGYYYYYGNTDWYSYLYNKARVQQDYNISVSGKSDKASYYIAGRFYDQEGMFKQTYGDNRYRSYSLRGNFNVDLTRNLKYTANIAVADNITTYPGPEDLDRLITGLGINLSPVFVPYNPDGTCVTQVRQLTGSVSITTNRMGQLLTNSGTNRKDAAKYNIKNSLLYTILPGWTATASYGIAYRNMENEFRLKNWECGIGPGLTYAYFNQSDSMRDMYKQDFNRDIEHNVDAFTNYSHEFGSGHNLALTAGMQYYHFYFRGTTLTGTNLKDEALTSFSLATKTDGFVVGESIHRLKTLGTFARVNYDYLGRYLIEISARADGSSRFEKGKRWAFFPSASAGWRISDEPFFQNAKGAVSNLKLRYSYGALGNQQMSSYYPYYDVIKDISVMSYTLDAESKLISASVSDPISSGLTWETVTTHNLGLDMGFLADRLSVTAEGYIRDTKNMLTTSITLPSVYGAASPKENCADLRTLGYEVYMTWKDGFTLAGKPFNYSVTGTLGDYKTIITRYNNPTKLLSDHYVGQVLGEIWGYHVEGLFKTDEEAQAYSEGINSKPVQGYVFSSKNPEESYLRAGDVIYADSNGDKIISQGSNTKDKPGDKSIIGNTNPRYLYSGRLDFDWNGFDFSMFLQGIGKRNWYPRNGDSSFNFWGPYALASAGFIHKDFESNCWSEDNTGAYFPRRRGKLAYSGSALGEINDRYLQNIGYLRLKNLSFGYTFKFKKGVEKMRVAFVGENLWYWSPMKKYCKIIDPELATSSNSQYSNCGSGFAFPSTYTLNLQINF